jgi:hypothetical protein
LAFHPDAESVSLASSSATLDEVGFSLGAQFQFAVIGELSCGPPLHVAQTLRTTILLV